MIRSKIDARERALELATQLAIALFKGGKACDLIPVAKELYEYLIGDAELPEVTDDNAHIKELLEIANKSFDNSRKCNNENIDDLTKFFDIRGIEHLAKSKAELKKTNKTK